MGQTRKNYQRVNLQGDYTLTAAWAVVTGVYFKCLKSSYYEINKKVMFSPAAADDDCLTRVLVNGVYPQDLFTRSSGYGANDSITIYASLKEIYIPKGETISLYAEYITAGGLIMGSSATWLLDNTYLEIVEK